MFLFDIIGQETIEKEYKEFSFKIDVEKYYEIEEINQVVKEGKLDQRFNIVVMDNIKHYAKYYIPKYISAFCNGDLLSPGKLYFGVDDDGEISGIPFLGNLPEKEVKKYIYKCIRDNIITTDTTKAYIFDQIKISLIPLEINPVLVYSDLQEYIQKMESEYQASRAIYLSYREKYLNWYRQLMMYSVKLVDFYKYHREPLRQFILKHDPEYIHTLDQELTSDMLLQIEELKNDPHHILHWICRLRDIKIEETSAQRPPKPYGRLKELYFINEFIKLFRLRKLLLETNPEIKYYLLEIEIPNGCPDEVFYKDIYGSIKKKTRILERGEPICI